MRFLQVEPLRAEEVEVSLAAVVEAVVAEAGNPLISLLLRYQILFQRLTISL